MQTLTLVEQSTQPQPIYPFSELDAGDLYPMTSDFQVIHTQDGRGAGLRALSAFKRGHLMAKVSGYLLASRRLHTLQINAHTHLYDPHFTGLLLHSCQPNVRLDMASFELWALRDIGQNEMLTMDYASTEDILMRQFECCCGSTNCRRWITGAKELPNEHGRAFLNKLESSEAATT
jgi:hypothetical protein